MGVMKLFDLSGKVSIVTGGGSGLGYAMAEALAEAGSDLLVCSRKEANCREAAQSLGRLGVDARGMKCDITDPSDIHELKDYALKEFGKIDVLINNSGATWGAPTEDYPIEGWKKVIDVNVTGTFLCSQIIGKVMIEKGGGKIVNVSSIFGGVGCKSEVMDAIAYNTSKGAMEAFTKDLAVKWAKHRIYVNAIAPAFVETKMTRVTMEKGAEHILSHLPLGRFGVPGDLKGAVVFLSSAASDYMTGTVLFVDGGYRAM
ncbi:MAG: SDR family oxidoreductase [Deltaproteobacteria bacterium]|nr:SDR family oxidoreductase [Deltaproteobacteria bacterium]MBW2139102.1 SDR family oxidoreductase [Deltaproteobacteria bacterium]